MDKNDLHVRINKIISHMKKKKVLDSKKISDKYHTFGDLYKHRIYLFLIICNQNKDIAWKSKKHYDEENDPMFNGDFIVGLYTPKGPASYHFKMHFWDLFDVPEIPNAPKYDGYSPDEALERFVSILDDNQVQAKIKK